MEWFSEQKEHQIFLDGNRTGVFIYIQSYDTVVTGWSVSNLQPIELPYMGGTFFTLAFRFSLVRMINILNIESVFTDANSNN